MEQEQEGATSPVTSFTNCMAEGRLLYQKGEYSKALESFTQALQFKPADKHCLVSRSKCHLNLGKSRDALKDAEASLETDKNFFVGLYQKAEALYAMGDFEFALVFYHRGYKLRPERQEFRLGIQKAREAIENSVGTPESVKLEVKEGTEFVSRQEESQRAKLKVKTQKKEQKKEDPARSEKTSRQLLGALYEDKIYLESLLKNEAIVNGKTRSGVRLQDMIMSGLEYLDACTEFFRQQKPIYTRERDRKLMQQQWKHDKSRIFDHSMYVLKSLDEIDRLLQKGKPEASCKKAQQVLKNIQSWSQEDVANKQELISNLHSCMGNAYLDLGQMDAALQSHQKDLDIANEYDLPDSKSRALDNTGRVYAKMGRFQDAIKVWEERIPLVTSSLEKTWLFHEIGRCYLELDQTVYAKDYGEMSQQAAGESGDVEWQLNACVLVAQAEVILKDYRSAVTSLERALAWAKQLLNEDAEQAIRNVLDNAKKGIAEEEKSDANLNKEPTSKEETDATEESSQDP